MADAKTLEELATADYWDARYSKPDAAPTYEWFKGFDNLQDFFIKHLPPPTADLRIIHLGCGNSVCQPIMSMTRSADSFANCPRNLRMQV